MRWMLVVSLLLVGCGGDEPVVEGDTGDISGTVRNAAAQLVAGARVKVGGVEVVTDARGTFEVKKVPKGSVSISVDAAWYEVWAKDVDVAPDQVNTADVELVARPLAIDAADEALAQAQQSTFDWRTSRVSFAVIRGPTHGRIDRAMYRANPGLFRDDSTEPPLTPSPAPSIVSGVASDFSFPRPGPGEVLQLESIVDTLAATGLPQAVQEQYMMWAPLLSTLLQTKETVDAAAPLAEVTAGVQGQSWGGSGARPQTMGRVFFDKAKNELWVEVVFGSFVALGPGITDSDGDGYAEVFAKVAPITTLPQLVAPITAYNETPIDTLGAKAALDNLISILYSTSNPAIVATLGEAYELPGLGSLKHPFAVVRHGNDALNVFLLAP